LPTEEIRSAMSRHECELLDRRRFKTQAEARIAVFEFIEGYYNPRHRHSSIGYLSPIDCERHAASPDAHQAAAVLAAVKDKPSGRPPSGAVLDRRRARRPHDLRAGMEEWLRRGTNKKSDRILIPSPQPPGNRGKSTWRVRRFFFSAK
jgi:hypothetical protein